MIRRSKAAWLIYPDGDYKVTTCGAANSAAGGKISIRHIGTVRMDIVSIKNRPK